LQNNSFSFIKWALWQISPELEKKNPYRQNHETGKLPIFAIIKKSPERTAFWSRAV
jgi:hypothetical protein